VELDTDFGIYRPSLRGTGFRKLSEAVLERPAPALSENGSLSSILEGAEGAIDESGVNGVPWKGSNSCSGGIGGCGEADRSAQQRGIEARRDGKREGEGCTPESWQGLLRDSDIAKNGGIGIENEWPAPRAPVHSLLRPVWALVIGASAWANVASPLRMTLL